MSVSPEINKTTKAIESVSTLMDSTLTANRVVVMGVLNVTPDSFSDGGKHQGAELAIRHAGFLLEHGVNVIDIGGESTRPGAATISVQEELDRVLPAVEAVVRRYPDIAVSVDTRKSAVAEAALKAGAKIMNDVSGLTYDSGMADVIARYQARLILMHSQGIPETMQINPDYPEGVIETIQAFFEQQIEVANRAGIPNHRIILDPGFGFGKTVEHNLTILSNLNRFTQNSHGEFPVLAGLSRKSFLVLGNQDIHPDQREALTAAAMAVAIQNGARWVRIHDPVVQIPVVRLCEQMLL